MRTHGAIGIAAGTGGVARRHTAQAGRCLGGVGGKELLGGSLELLVCPKRRLVPTACQHRLFAQLFAQLRQHDARLHAQQKPALVIAAKTEVAIHARGVEDMPAMRHGAGSEARSGTLDGHRNTVDMELPQDSAHLVFRCRKRNARSLARRARLVAAVFLELIGEGFDGCRHADSPLANYSVCREMLPHRFVDVFETASIIEVFYAHAIRRTAEFPRQAMLLTHIVPPPAIA